MKSYRLPCCVLKANYDYISNWRDLRTTYKLFSCMEKKNFFCLASEVICDQFIWSIGGGTSIHCKKDRWFSRGTFSRMPICYNVDLIAAHPRVDYFITDEGGWNSYLVEQCFPFEYC